MELNDKSPDSIREVQTKWGFDRTNAHSGSVLERSFKPLKAKVRVVAVVAHLPSIIKRLFLFLKFKISTTEKSLKQLTAPDKAQYRLQLILISAQPKQFRKDK